jgi:hypothetical protein
MIEQSEMLAAQQSWARGVMDLGTEMPREELLVRAEEHVRAHYLLDGSLLFCPTMAAVQQFRSTLDGVISYFVGGNPDFPEDKGFTLESWTAIRFENAGVISRDGVGIAMGNYFFGRADGTEVKAEFSFVYVRDEQGHIKIQLHHSALPFSH